MLDIKAIILHMALIDFAAVGLITVAMLLAVLANYPRVMWRKKIKEILMLNSLAALAALAVVSFAAFLAYGV